MALKVPVKLYGVYNVLIDNSAGRAIATPVGILGLGEEPYMVTLARDEQCDLRVDLEILARLCRYVRS